MAPAKYDHIDFTPSDAMKTEARRGLDWRDEYGRGGTRVGIARARDISNGRTLSPETARRMFSFFSRHEGNATAEGFDRGEDGYPSNGRIAWALWGGDAGFAWARQRVEQMDSADKKKESPQLITSTISITKAKDGLRRMLLVSSNGYIDREYEHVTEKALEHYVNSVWLDDDYVGTNVLLFWHSDGHLNASRNAIGDIIYAEMMHGFLIEIAKERTDEIVDISRKGVGNEPYLKRVSEIWDTIEAEPDAWGASIGFAYLDDPDAPDEPATPKEYDKIYKFETSVLPREYASNPYTLSKVVRQGAT